MSRGTFVALCLSALLSGCAVGPDYDVPAGDVGSIWLSMPGGEAGSELPDRWWSLLDDPVLERFLIRAAESNYDIAIARARVEEAQASRSVAQSAFWPRADLNGRYTKVEQSIDSPGAGGALIDAGLIPRDVDFYSTSIDASWELDVFGGRRRQTEAASAELQSVEANARAVELAVLSETANAYFEMRGAMTRLEIAQSNVAAQERTLDLTRRKVESGLARRIDELRAEAQWETARSIIPSLRAALRAGSYRLAVLTGQPPGDIDPAVFPGDGLPAPPAEVPVGLRAELLRRRPDVLAAERQLAAATAEIGVAKADFFPRFVLSAGYGFESAEPGDLGNGRARTTSLVPFLSWPVFQGGRLRANLAGANARALAASFGYERAVLAALADAESAITAYTEEAATFRRLDAAAEASIRAARIAAGLYEQGLVDFLTVLDAQRRRDDAADARARSRIRLLLNLSGLYKALGGGWQV